MSPENKKPRKKPTKRLTQKERLDKARSVYRTGVAPQYTSQELLCLLEALRSDDPRIMQGMTTWPPPVESCMDMPVEACCVLTFPRLKDETTTVRELEIYFTQLAVECDRRLNEEHAIRWFLSVYEQLDRSKMRQVMSEEIELELSRRAESI